MPPTTHSNNRKLTTSKDTQYQLKALKWRNSRVFCMIHLLTAVKRREDGTVYKECVDGKQSLVAAIYWRSTICIEYEDLVPQQEREIFLRLQEGLALTNAEKMATICTPRADFARSLVNQYFTEKLGHSDISLNLNRGWDLACFAAMAEEESRKPWNGPFVHG
ncbi:hypothetical protein PQX77_003009 [Marasmius sp. AFHP31]|nr:hypothetical protein PQX77_003009 [Marasmius sp. AFHP31]